MDKEKRLAARESHGFPLGAGAERRTVGSHPGRPGRLITYLEGGLMIEPDVISVPQAAELLGISKDLGYDLARRGELPGAIQLGLRWRVSLIRLRGAVHGADDGNAGKAHRIIAGQVPRVSR
jgi:excisionase family DNA binding protein